MSLRTLQSIFTFNHAILVKYAYSRGYELTDGDAYRDPLLAIINSGEYGLIEKATNVITWLAKRGIRNSLHCSRLARDYNLFRDGRYLSTTEDHRELGRYWESLNSFNRWGGRYGDGNHYEMVPYKWRDESYKPL
jgi:hypothetical protein